MESQIESQIESLIKSQMESNVILDGRTTDKYDMEHIDGSYSITFPYILAKSIAKNPKKFVEYILDNEPLKIIKKINDQKIGHILYLIDNTFLDPLRKSLEKFYDGLIEFVLYEDYKNEHKDIKLVQTIYTQKYPVVESPQKPNGRFEISKIISGLYLGGEESAMNKELLKKNNVSVILNITNYIPFYHETEFTYHRIPIIDSHNVNIKQYFDDTFKIIDDVIMDNKNILVHCHAGISRSATIVIAYIMKKNKMKINEAYKFVHEKRPCIEPNIGFYAQLMVYEKELNL